VCALRLSTVLGTLIRFLNDVKKGTWWNFSHSFW